MTRLQASWRENREGALARAAQLGAVRLAESVVFFGGEA